MSDWSASRPDLVSLESREVLVNPARFAHYGPYDGDIILID
jgi:hypothetical protein